jgi:hypothetical protein
MIKFERTLGFLSKGGVTDGQEKKKSCKGPFRRSSNLSVLTIRKKLRLKSRALMTYIVKFALRTRWWTNRGTKRN